MKSKENEIERRILKIIDVTITGELGKRIAQAVRNATEVPHPRAWEHYCKKPTEYEWGGDFQGRWLEVASLWQSCCSGQRTSIEHSVGMLLNAMSKDGSIRRKGRANDDFHVMISNWKALCGLLAAYEATGHQVLLDAAKKMGLRYWKRYADASRYPRKPLFSTQLPSAIECLVKLYKITRDKRYLDVAVALCGFTVKTSERVIEQSTVHTHTWLSAVRGLVDVYIVSRNSSLLKAAERIWQYVHDHVVWLSGGIPEVTFKSDDCTDESCAVSDWIRLNLSLWQATGESKYLEDAERALLNHSYFTQLPNGGMSAACNIEQGFRGSEGWMCCSFNAPLMFHQLTRTIFAASEGVAWINFLLPGQAQLDIGNGRMFNIEQVGSYPDDGKVRIRINPDKEMAATIAIRLPAWLSIDDLSIAVNGKAIVRSVLKDGYLVLKRHWKRGDVVKLDFSMPLHAERSIVGGHKPLGKVRINDNKPVPAKLIAVFRGSLLLTILRTDHNLDLSWVNRNGFNEVLDSGGYYGEWNGSSCDMSGSSGVSKVTTSRPANFADIRVADSNVKVTWQSKLDGVAEIENRLTVFNRLPVEIVHAQRVKLKPHVNRDKLMLCGTRIAKMKEQWQEKYCYSATYKYTKPDLEIKKSQGYVLKNDEFEVSCSCSGAVGSVVPVKNKKWLGVFVRPASGGVSANRNGEFYLSKRMIFSRPAYTGTSWIDTDTKSGDQMLTFGRKKVAAPA